MSHPTSRGWYSQDDEPTAVDRIWDKIDFLFLLYYAGLLTVPLFHMAIGGPNATGEVGMGGMIFLIIAFIVAIVLLGTVYWVIRRIAGRILPWRIGFNAMAVAWLVISQLLPTEEVPARESPAAVAPSPVRSPAEGPAKVADPKPSLHDAASSGDLRVLKRLIHEGVDLNARDRYGRTALILAGAQLPVLELLAAQGADPNLGHDCQTLWANLKGESAEAIIALADRLSDIQMPLDADGLPCGGPLHVFASAGQSRLVRYFLDRGLPAGQADRRGLTPLHVLMRDLPGPTAAVIEIAVQLLDAGADIEARDKEGRTAEMMLDASDPREIRWFMSDRRVDFLKAQAEAEKAR